MAMPPDKLAALKSDYEANILSFDQLARKYELTPARIQRYAVQEGWNRHHKPTEEEVHKTVSLFSFDTSENQLLTAATVVGIHRKDVAKLRSVAATLIDRLAIEMSGQQLPEGQICRGGRESPADLLEKLSRVMVRTTEIERQAYGLKTFNPEKEATDAELAAELDTLTQDLEKLAREKAVN